MSDDIFGFTNQEIKIRTKTALLKPNFHMDELIMKNDHVSQNKINEK